MSIKEQVMKMKAVSPKMAALTTEQRNKALECMMAALEANKEEILAANKVDMDKAVADNIASAVLKRLKFDEHKLQDVIAGIKELIKLPDPLNKKLMARELDENLKLYRVSCPIGVIGVIFEARPDALVQISSLCLKSGNCAILKGGSETFNTNKALFNVIYKSIVEAGVPEGSFMLAESRSEISELLQCNGYVDLLIPRGSNQFVQYIMNNTKIPVMGHADGICHIYVDKDADVDKAVKIIIDAKTQ